MYIQSVDDEETTESLSVPSKITECKALTNTAISVNIVQKRNSKSSLCSESQALSSVATTTAVQVSADEGHQQTGVNSFHSDRAREMRSAERKEYREQLSTTAKANRQPTGDEYSSLEQTPDLTTTETSAKEVVVQRLHHTGRTLSNGKVGEGRHKRHDDVGMTKYLQRDVSQPQRQQTMTPTHQLDQQQNPTSYRPPCKSADRQARKFPDRLSVATGQKYSCSESLFANSLNERPTESEITSSKTSAKQFRQSSKTVTAGRQVSISSVVQESEACHSSHAKRQLTLALPLTLVQTKTTIKKERLRGDRKVPGSASVKSAETWKVVENCGELTGTAQTQNRAVLDVNRSGAGFSKNLRKNLGKSYDSRHQCWEEKEKQERAATPSESRSRDEQLADERKSSKSHEKSSRKSNPRDAKKQLDCVALSPFVGRSDTETEVDCYKTSTPSASHRKSKSVVKRGRSRRRNSDGMPCVCDRFKCADCELDFECRETMTQMMQTNCLYVDDVTKNCLDEFTSGGCVRLCDSVDTDRKQQSCRGPCIACRPRPAVESMTFDDVAGYCDDVDGAECDNWAGNDDSLWQSGSLLPGDVCCEDVAKSARKTKCTRSLCLGLASCKRVATTEQAACCCCSDNCCNTCLPVSDCDGCVGSDVTSFVRNKAVLGELSAQLDCRILQYVFSPQHATDCSASFYGYLVKEIPAMIEKDCIIDRQLGTVDHGRRYQLLYRFKYVQLSLKPFGYDFKFHPDFSAQLVNRYGRLLTNGDNRKLVGSGRLPTVDIFSRRELRDIIEMVALPDEREHCLVLLNCLALLAADDCRPLFVWS